MSDANLLPRRQPALSTIANPQGSASLQVFDGYPGERDWALEVQARARARTPSRTGAQFSNMLAMETGAPIGPFAQESYRVARAFGVVTPNRIARTSSPDTPVLGACMAQGLCYATWKQSGEDSFLVITFNAPSAFGWDGGQDSLSLEHLKARCTHQFTSQAQSLLAHIPECATATGVLPDFQGVWGPETEHVRRGLATACVRFWMEQVRGRLAALTEGEAPQVAFA